MHFLITAGPTREPLDPVRFISNRSSGQMGYQVAGAALEAGHQVTLVSGPVSLEPPAGSKVLSVVTAEEMYEACLRVYGNVDVVVATAAVCDYRPVRISGHKIKKGAETLTLKMVRTQDTLAELGRRKTRQILVGFALEDRQPKTAARKKFREKKLDAIVLNSPAALSSSRNQVSVF